MKSIDDDYLKSFLNKFCADVRQNWQAFSLTDSQKRGQEREQRLVNSAQKEINKHFLATIKAGLPETRDSWLLSDIGKKQPQEFAQGWNAHNKAVEEYLNELFGGGDG